MATKKNESVEVKRGELVNAAKELNIVIELDPPINVKSKPEELTEKLLEAATLLDVEDEITDETSATLTAIGAKLPKAAKTSAKTSAKTEKKAEEKSAPAKKEAKKESAKKPAGKAKVAEPTKEELSGLVNELNSIEGMVEIEFGDDILDTTVKADIIEAAGTLSPADAATLTDGAWATLAMLGVKKPVAEKAKAEKKADTKKPAAKPEKDKKECKVIHEKDKWGFRPGCKKSLVMDRIAKGGAKFEDLKAEFKGQLNFAIKETAERSGTIVITDKNGIVSIKK